MSLHFLLSAPGLAKKAKGRSTVPKGKVLAPLKTEAPFSVLRNSVPLFVISTALSLHRNCADQNMPTHFLKEHRGDGWASRRRYYLPPRRLPYGHRAS
jgi:hypothetical protein